ncbi:hypothetical protein C5167_001674 [Papaver somniferum]|uniref:GTPase Der n=1 Tax=Papaver somniferum TaxID=3469 RepID=A0A4Y7KVX3_PAPSO|nr:hypothetical protein C5167_001674 [Papaver somniferum]
MSVRDLCVSHLTPTISRVSKFPSTCFPSPFLNKNLSLPKNLLTSNFLLSIEKSNTTYQHNCSQFVPKSSDAEISGVEDELVGDEGIESSYSDDEDNIDSFEIDEIEREAREAVSGNRAIVVDEPGVTRDRLYGRSFWRNIEFMVIDTGGVITVSKSQASVLEDLAISTTVGMDGIPLASREAAVARMPSMIESQATVAVEEASVLIFVVDGQAGLSAADVEIADWLRKNYSDKTIILAVNKCESPRKGVMQASEFWSLGYDPLPISAVTGTGTGELLDLVCSTLKTVEASEDTKEQEKYVPAIAIVGRPNVGKSSILNALVGEDRTVVSPISGTTRDAIDTQFTAPDGQEFRLIDTAGIRRRAFIATSGSTTEALSVNRAFRAIRRSDVVALVIEALACVAEQQTATYYEQDVREKLRILDWAPIVYSTAMISHSVEKVIIAASTVEKERSRRLGTSILNQVVQEALAFKSPPQTRGGKRGRIYYTTQAAIRPPTFVFFVNDAKLFSETYRRYMEKQLRSDAGFAGTPIRLLWRSRKKMEREGRGAAATNTLVPFQLQRQKKLATAATIS